MSYNPRSHFRLAAVSFSGADPRCLRWSRAGLPDGRRFSVNVTRNARSAFVTIS